jgi:two-component system, OmpR family, KDP operon response regulator KdpE
VTASPHILIIDDEAQILRAIRTILTGHHYRVTAAHSGEEGLALAAAEKPDVIILDLGLPDMNGLEVCARLREWTQTPIIVLSVRDAEQDKVQALDHGADDYLVKPFGIAELLARIRVALRHSALAQGSPDPVVGFGEVRVDLARRVVTRAGQEIRLTATEFKLLAYLIGNTGRVLTHQSILNHVWGPGYANNVEYLRVFISSLRKKMEEDPRHPQHFLSEPGVGYRFSPGE